jgi:ParB-like nuclease domain
LKNFEQVETKKEKNMKWTNEQRTIDSLRDYPNNPRTAEPKGMANLKQSIESVGYVEPIAINTDGTILSGHRRKEILERLGMTEVDVRVPERILSETECKEVVIRLNRNIAGVWNMESLTADFEVDELMDWGFTDFELGVHGSPEGIAFDETVTDGESVMTSFKIKLPATNAEPFEVRLDEILRDFPEAVKEKKV